jgi:hypothetical protein
MKKRTVRRNRVAVKFKGKTALGQHRTGKASDWERREKEARRSETVVTSLVSL